MDNVTLRISAEHSVYIWTGEHVRNPFEIFSLRLSSSDTYLQAYVIMVVGDGLPWNTRTRFVAIGGSAFLRAIAFCEQRNLYFQNICQTLISQCTGGWRSHGPRMRYVKLQVAHAPGMSGTFSPPPRVSDPDMHHGTCVTRVPWCMPWSLTSGFL